MMEYRIHYVPSDYSNLQYEVNWNEKDGEDRDNI